MNNYILKGLVFLNMLFLLSCEKDDLTPASMPEPLTHPVAQVLESNYWQEKICFTYIEQLAFPEPGEDSPVPEIKVTDDIIDEYMWSGGTYLDARLDRFYVDPETKKLRVYLGAPYIGNWYYQNLYAINYPDSNHVILSSSKDLNAQVGAATETFLKVVSCTEKEIILDGAIKPYIWQNWKLDEIGKSKGIMYLGIRVYWTRIENGSEIYEPSNPLD